MYCLSDNELSSYTIVIIKNTYLASQKVILFMRLNTIQSEMINFD